MSQGSVLTPLLYLLYVKDIFNVSNVVKSLLYAGDIVLIISYTKSFFRASEQLDYIPFSFVTKNLL